MTSTNLLKPTSYSFNGLSVNFQLLPSPTLNKYADLICVRPPSSMINSSPRLSDWRFTLYYWNINLNYKCWVNAMTFSITNWELTSSCKIFITLLSLMFNSMLNGFNVERSSLGRNHRINQAFRGKLVTTC